MNPELQPTPCPICGKPPTIKGMRLFDVYHSCDEKPNWYLELRQQFKTRAEAVENWNWLMAALKGKKE